MAARKGNAFAVILIRAGIAGIHIKWMILVGPLHTGPVGTRYDREAVLPLRSTTGCKNRPNAKAAAGARSPGGRIDVQKIERAIICGIYEARLACDGLLDR